MPTNTFPGRYDSLPAISEYVVEAAKKAELSDAAIYAVDLAVDEACTNIIEHAYGGEGRGDIVCTYEILSDGLKIVLRDIGQSFKPNKVPKPDPKTPLKDIQTRGAGLFLIKKMMDEVYFDFGGKQGNTLTLIKRR